MPNLAAEVGVEPATLIDLHRTFKLTRDSIDVRLIFPDPRKLGAMGHKRPNKAHESIKTIMQLSTLSLASQC